jgi:DNA adenine methylase
MRPLIPWIGGKRRLAPFILPLFPDHTCYVEAFAGAAALFWLKQPAEVEVLNDINGELVNLYRVVKHHLEEFVRQFKWALSSRKIFEWQQMTRPETLTDIQRAARFFYLQKLAFGGRVDGQSYGTATTAGPRLNLLRLEEDLSLAHLRLSDVHIEHLPWADCITRYDRPHTLFYCDPPYWQTEGYGVDFPFENYERLAMIAGGSQGTVIISVNDHPDMRRVFAGFPMRGVPITYTVGGAGASTEVAELVIGNWRGGWPEPRPLSRQLGLDDL